MTQINFRIDDEVKESAERALKAMGLTMSAAITMFLTKVGREQRIPFEITADPFYSEKNMKYLEKIIDDIESGRAKLTEHELIEVDDDEDTME
ncbi:MAG: type II toxin-antitoxin system RelB/DinJ family antitoxin [Ruminococcus sp.]|nr:type II toxin-antitoxin system RelB/DinJ family antitoxin [Ruminococcus sp.]